MPRSVENCMRYIRVQMEKRKLPDEAVQTAVDACRDAMDAGESDEAVLKAINESLDSWRPGESATANGDELPDDFPSVRILRKAGVTTFSQLDEPGVLDAVDRIGPLRRQEILGMKNRRHLQ